MRIGDTRCLVLTVRKHCTHYDYSQCSYNTVTTACLAVGNPRSYKNAQAMMTMLAVTVWHVVRQWRSFRALQISNSRCTGALHHAQQRLQRCCPHAVWIGLTSFGHAVRVVLSRCRPPGGTGVGPHRRVRTVTSSTLVYIHTAISALETRRDEDWCSFVVCILTRMSGLFV